MDHFSEMNIFIAVAEESSLAAAARRLDLSPPTITRAMASLEQRLSTSLLTRSTRGVELTEAGARYLFDCQRILHDLEEAEASAAGLHAVPAGKLVIAAPLLFGQDVLMPIVLDFLNEHPQIHITAHFADRTPNLHEEGVDVAFLTGNLPDSSLVAVKAGNIHRVICASPSYLAKMGEPQHPEELVQHQIVQSLADAKVSSWQFMIDNQMTTLDIKPRLITSTNTSAIIAAIEHAGIIRVMSYQVSEALWKNQLCEILRPFVLPAIPLHVVYRDGRRAATRVRSFVDYVIKRLRLASL